MPVAAPPKAVDNGQAAPTVTLLTIVGDHVKIRGGCSLRAIAG
jgi:hypothetical protein